MNHNDIMLQPASVATNMPNRGFRASNIVRVPREKCKTLVNLSFG